MFPGVFRKKVELNLYENADGTKGCTVCQEPAASRPEKQLQAKKSFGFLGSHFSYLGHKVGSKIMHGICEPCFKQLPCLKNENKNTVKCPTCNLDVDKKDWHKVKLGEDLRCLRAHKYFKDTVPPVVANPTPATNQAVSTSSSYNRREYYIPPRYHNFSRAGMELMGILNRVSRYSSPRLSPEQERALIERERAGRAQGLRNYLMRVIFPLLATAAAISAICCFVQKSNQK